MDVVDVEVEPLFTDDDRLAGWVFYCPTRCGSIAGPSKARVQVEASEHMVRMHPEQVR